VGYTDSRYTMFDDLRDLAVDSLTVVFSHYYG